jgi:hypothetical protein
MIDVTEDEIRKSGEGQPPEFTQAFVDLWKQDKITPVGPNAKGKIIWCANEEKASNEASETC